MALLSNQWFDQQGVVEMHLVGPYRYTVTVQNGRHVLLDDSGRIKFFSPVSTRCPKIYVFATENLPVYVGQTVQGMGARMRLGFLADGSSGYYGYRWRHELESAQLLVWCLEGIAKEDAVHASECIESEIVFSYRVRYNQWPKYQTEIHFHETSAEHRALAAQVFGFFTGDKVEPTAAADRPGRCGLEQYTVTEGPAGG